MKTITNSAIITELISKGELRYKKSKSIYEKIGIKYNLIILKYEHGHRESIYINVKEFIELEVQLIKSAQYGYDSINREKLSNILNFLRYEEQISAIKFALSVLKKELPEMDKDWLYNKREITEVKMIFSKRKFEEYPKALLLYTGISIKNLLIVFITLFTLVYCIFLPAQFSCFHLFSITYEYYSPIFYLNHLFNVITLFCGFDNNFKIQPLNGIGIFILAFGKIAFILLIVNFIYRKISDKITNL